MTVSPTIKQKGRHKPDEKKMKEIMQFNWIALSKEWWGRRSDPGTLRGEDEVQVFFEWL